MQGMSHNQVSPVEVHFYFEGKPFVSVVRGNIFFLPASAAIMENWEPKDVIQLSNYMAPFIAEMLN